MRADSRPATTTDESVSPPPPLLLVPAGRAEPVVVFVAVRPSGRPPLAANQTDRYARGARDLRDSTAALTCTRARALYGCQLDGTKRLVSSLMRIWLASLRACAPNNAFRGGTRFSSRTSAAAAAGRCSGTRRDDESTSRLESVCDTVETRRCYSSLSSEQLRDLVGRYEWTNTIMIRLRPQRYASEPVRNE